MKGCVVCQKTFEDEVALSKHLEEFHVEKTWLITQPAPVEGSSIRSPSEDIIYVLSKKEASSNFEFVSLKAEEVRWLLRHTLAARWG